MIEPKTEREEIIKLEGKVDVVDGKISYILDSLERVLLAIEHIDNIKMEDLGKRIGKIEQFIASWNGIYKFLVVVSVVVSIVAVIFSLKYNIMEDFTILYAGTALLLILSTIIILSVVWNNRMMTRQRKFVQDRDAIYSQRIGNLETLMKTEFKKIIELLKPRI